MIAFRYCREPHGRHDLYRPRWFHRFRRRRLGRTMIRELNLNQDQEMLLQSVLTMLQGMQRGIFDDFGERAEKFRALLHAPVIDRSDMRDLLHTTQESVFDRLSRAADEIAGFVDSLSPEQRVMVAAWLEKGPVCGADRPFH